MNRISLLRSNPFTINHCFCFQLLDLCCSFWLWEFYVLNLVVWGCVGRSPHQPNQSQRKPKLRRRARRGRTRTNPSVLQLPFSSSCKAHSFSVLMFCGLRCCFLVLMWLVNLSGMTSEKSTKKPILTLRMLRR